MQDRVMRVSVDKAGIPPPAGDASHTTDFLYSENRTSTHATSTVEHNDSDDMQRARNLQRDDSSLIIHFDYDCFYASVVENENPALKSVPLAIQQKQIVVTCNYEARRRGLRKLQLITEAKKVCPEAVIVLGEDLTRFRDASKELYSFLRDSVWSGRAERLGFDEVWYVCIGRQAALS